MRGSLAREIWQKDQALRTRWDGEGFGVDLSPGRPQRGAYPLEGEAGVLHRRHRVPPVGRGRSIDVGAGGRIDRQPVARSDDLRPAADGELRRSGIEQPPGDGRRRGVGSAADHREVGSHAKVLGGLAGQDATNLCRLTNRGQQVEPQIERVEDVFGPVIRAQVVEQRGRGVAGLGGRFMGQAQAKPVLRLERPLSRPVLRPLVVAQPEQGRAGHAGGGRIGQLAPQGLAELPVGVQLATRPQVRPENGRAQRLAQVIAEDDTMHLARESDGGDLGGVIAGGLPGCGGGGLPPVLWVGL